MTVASPFRHHRVTVGHGEIHAAEAGHEDAPPVLFLHGWPESWSAWTEVMAMAAGDGYRAVSIDLPGVGGSFGAGTGAKREIAACVHDLMATMGLSGAVLVGHDVGGMATFAYLRRYDDLDRAVIMNTVIPGLPPWDSVIRNPYIWHFAFHAIPKLPESLVQGRQAEYFDYFFETISVEPSRITADRRRQHASAYSSDGALKAGFDWYRTLPQDADENAKPTTPIATPTLYVRGDGEMGAIEDYSDGLRDAGLQELRTGLIGNAGHFAPEESPDSVWRLISTFLASPR
jgi:pimeloyl-ACP methyl ester carboxylesterase